jgi:hypothetical protein
VAGKVDGDQLVVPGELRPDRSPVPARTTRSVEQKERLARSGAFVGNARNFHRYLRRLLN